MKKYTKLIRAHQWIKNFFLFIPIIFSGNFNQLDNVLKVIAAFFSFSFIASCMYILNDIKDVENDRKHPTKKNRPIAAGIISIKRALAIAAILSIVSLVVAIFINLQFLGVVLIYILINFIYTQFTKHLPIWDILFLASFYIIRVYAGGRAIDVPISSWLLLTTFFSALFIGAGKRYVELIMNTSGSRKVLSSYSKEFLNYALTLSSFCTILFYVLYTTTKSFYFELSSIFVITGFLNYFFHLYKNDIHEDPVQALIKSRSMLLLVILWVIYILTIVALKL